MSPLSSDPERVSRQNFVVASAAVVRTQRPKWMDLLTSVVGAKMRALPPVASVIAVACLCLLSACTQQADPGPSNLERRIQDSGQNLALSFDGIDDYATTGTARFPNGWEEQTVSAWFMVSALPERAALLTLRKDFDSGIELGLRKGVVGVWRVAADKPLVSAKNEVTTNVWHHAAYTYDKDSNALYVDGVLVATSTDSPDKRTPTTCWVGTLDGAHDLFQGQMDEAHVFETVRTAAQIALEVGGQFSSNLEGLVLDLTFNESTGNLVFDHSEQQNDGLLGDGVLQRMPAREQAGLTATDY